MIERLTPAAKDTLEEARAEAERRGSPVEPRHLLLALVAEPYGAAARILRELGVRREAVRAELRAPDEPPGPGVPPAELSADLRRALELAAEEAREGGHELVDTDHLLLGLVRLAKAPLSDVLARAGLTLDAIRPLVASAGTIKKDLLDVRAVIERSRSKVSLRDLEAKGFRKVKVLRCGDIHQLIKKAVERTLAGHSAVLSLDDRNRIATEAKAEYDRQQALLQEISRREDTLALSEHEIAQREHAIATAHRNLETKLAAANAQLVAERNKILEERAELIAARRVDPNGIADLRCPFGHGSMDRVVRQGVRLAVCGECLSTLLEPGQLDALVRKLSELSVDALHLFLEPESPRLGGDGQPAKA